MLRANITSVPLPTPSWLHAGDHVNIVVSGTAGAVHRQEHLARQSAWINRVAETEAAAKVDLSDFGQKWA